MFQIEQGNPFFFIQEKHLHEFPLVFTTIFLPDSVSQLFFSAKSL